MGREVNRRGVFLEVERTGPGSPRNHPPVSVPDPLTGKQCSVLRFHYSFPDPLAGNQDRQDNQDIQDHQEVPDPLTGRQDRQDS